MRHTPTLTLLTALLLAILAQSAPTATAQSVEVQSEPGQEHCADTCDIHIVGSSTVDLYLGTTFIAGALACNDEFVASLDENGEGFIHTYENNHPASAGVCTRVSCQGAAGEWPTEITETAGALSARITLCLAPEDETQSLCTIDVAITQPEENPHHYVFTAQNAECPASPPFHAFLNGNWEVEDTNWELAH